MNEINTQIHSIVNSSLTELSTSFQKHVVNLSAKLQLYLTQMQLDTQKEIAVIQARFKEKIMKHIQESKDATEAKHGEEMRSLLINLTKELQTSNSNRPPVDMLQISQQNISASNETSSSRLKTKQSSTAITELASTPASSLQKSLAKAPFNEKVRQQSNSFDDNHPPNYQATDHVSRMPRASEKTYLSFGTNLSFSNANNHDFSISVSSSNHLLNPVPPLVPPLSIITQPNQLNRDSLMLRENSGSPFNAPTHQEPPNSGQC